MAYCRRPCFPSCVTSGVRRFRGFRRGRLARRAAGLSSRLRQTRSPLPVKRAAAVPAAAGACAEKIHQFEGRRRPRAPYASVGRAGPSECRCGFGARRRIACSVLAPSRGQRAVSAHDGQCAGPARLQLVERHPDHRQQPASNLGSDLQCVHVRRLGVAAHLRLRPDQRTLASRTGSVQVSPPERHRALVTPPGLPAGNAPPVQKNCH